MIQTRNKLIYGLLMATCLGGCTMIPTMDQPSMPVAQTWADIPQDGLQTQDGLATQLGWQSFFESPELKQIIQITLDNNKDLKTAALNIESARALYRIQRSDLLPSIDANGAGSISKSTDNSSATGNGTRSEIYEANIGMASYELDVFGRIRSLNEAALNDYLATEQAYDVVKNALIAEVANAYLQFLSDIKLLELTEQTLQAQQETYDLVEISLKNGIGTDLDLAGARTTVEQARANYHQYKRLVDQDKNALFLLMGVAHNNDLIPLVSFDTIRVKENLDPSIPSQVLLKRPDIKQAEFELLSANADIGAARAAFFPSISLTGTAGFASQDLSDLFSGGSAGAWSFAPTITLPIFHAGENRANLELAEIQKDISIVAYEQAIQTAFKEVADELAARASLDQQLKAQQDLVTAAQKVYDITYARYKSGIDDFLDVLDAQRELYSYQQDVIATEQLRLTNFINLYKVLGGI